MNLREYEDRICHLRRHFDVVHARLQALPMGHSEWDAELVVATFEGHLKRLEAMLEMVEEDIFFASAGYTNKAVPDDFVAVDYL